jgi:hypothetical protein
LNSSRAFTPFRTRCAPGSVGLQVAATPAGNELFGNAHSVSDNPDALEVVVDYGWVEKQGYAIPRMTQIRDLFSLFYDWNRDGLRQFLAKNINILTKSELDPTIFMQQDEEQLLNRFSSDEMQKRLLDLRGQLSQFVLTVPDLMTLLKETVPLFLRDGFSISFSYGQENLELASIRPNLFLSRMFYWMKLPAAWSVNIPGTIPAGRWHYPKKSANPEQMNRDAG